MPVPYSMAASNVTVVVTATPTASQTVAHQHW
jgi:hypothetical protein